MRRLLESQEKSFCDYNVLYKYNTYDTYLHPSTYVPKNGQGPKVPMPH